MNATCRLNEYNSGSRFYGFAPGSESRKCQEMRPNGGRYLVRTWHGFKPRESLMLTPDNEIITNLCLGMKH